uniref:Ovule protein n=1 Tax=Strongyloides papillosus TaxID=174720 RepID=A0A0N5B7D9_STREA
MFNVPQQYEEFLSLPTKMFNVPQQYEEFLSFSSNSKPDLKILTNYGRPRLDSLSSTMPKVTFVSRPIKQSSRGLTSLRPGQ